MLLAAFRSMSTSSFISTARSLTTTRAITTAVALIVLSGCGGADDEANGGGGGSSSGGAGGSAAGGSGGSAAGGSAGVSSGGATNLGGAAGSAGAAGAGAAGGGSAGAGGSGGTGGTGGTSPGKLKAFPTAWGGGSDTTGGRGGIVVRVTTLADSGSGSLREALLMKVPRTIVFDVSGRIHLTSMIELIKENSDFTLAGQTAPKGGITISGRPLQLGGGYSRSPQPCNNVIIRHIRFRNGSYTGQADAYMHNGLISSGTDKYVIDHCSFSFNDDQAISFNANYGPLQNGTVQRSIFSENATGAIVGLTNKQKNDNFTFIYNLWADQTHRTPNVGGSVGARYDILNNVKFNWKARLTNANSGAPQINYIGNYLKVGAHVLRKDSSWGAHAGETHDNKVQNVPTSIYTALNYHSEKYKTPVLDDRNIWSRFSGPSDLDASAFTTKQHALLPNTPTILPAATAYTNVLADVGANRYMDDSGNPQTYLDSYDTTKIANVSSGKSSDPSNTSWTQPTLPTNTRPASYDTDKDGMADAWEMKTFGNLSKSPSGNDLDPGYTNIEMFMNQ